LTEPAAQALRVLVVDDDRNIRATLAVCLEGIGCRVTQAASADAALDAVRERPFDLALLDLRLGTASGLDLLPQLAAGCPGLSIVIVTAYSTIETAVEAMKRGASDYLAKPFTPEQIRQVAARVAREREAQARIAELARELHDAAPEVELETESPAMRAVLETIARAAASDAPVLLRGESGTGKGVLARTLHAKSPRRGRPFVVVSCPTLSAELLTSELFGHARGSFTGALRDQPGRVEAAEGGTLFLDEIAELAPPLQAKLLRFVQEKQFERIGEARVRSADVRVVAATNRELEAEVAAGRFREDLLYRLNVLEIRVPPLRERGEDVLRLARHFLAFFAVATKRAVPELSPAAERALVAYPWPGNVRELRNAIERAVILWPSRVIEPAAFPERISAVAATAPGPRAGGEATLEEVEREQIRRVLERAATLEEAAHILGIDASTLWRKRRKYGF
jgi:NtrC-family two-component system response regulator AlgB